MKALLTLGLLLIGPMAWADNGNLLRNGDFSDGVTHWEGDCHLPESAGDGAAPAAGVVVKLRSEWTKIVQNFDGKIGEYTFTVSYTLSPDIKFSDRKDDYESIPSHLGFEGLKSFWEHPGEWAVIITDLGALQYNYWKITPSTGGAGSQTIGSDVNLDADGGQVFCLAFPPGFGSVTIQNISLLPKASGNP